MTKFLKVFPMPSTDSTRPSLLEGVRNSSPNAWYQLFDIYSPLVLAWGKRLGCNPEECEDLSQEVFQTVSSSIHQFRGDGQSGSFRGWLWRITYRKWIDRTRQVRDELRAAGGSTAAEELNQFADPDAEGMPEPSTPDLLGAVLQRGIEIVQSEFQDRHWRAFWLTAIEGLSTDVAADKLNMSASMVRQCRSRILRRLRQVMGDLG